MMEDIDVYELANAIRISYLRHGNDSWLTIAREVIEQLKQDR